MNLLLRNTCSKIHTSEEGEVGPIDALEEAMRYQYEKKQTPKINGSKALPMDQLKTESFYPKREENIETTKTVQLMSYESA